MKRPHLALAAALLALAAQAQSDYPGRPVTMIVPFPPGGVADITARPVAEAMGRFLQHPVVVENKAGAGGGVGMQYVTRSKPDGYTVLLALSSISIIPEADKVLGRDPMFQLNQLVPIAPRPSIAGHSSRASRSTDSSSSGSVCSRPWRCRTTPHSRSEAHSRCAMGQRSCWAQTVSGKLSWHSTDRCLPGV